MAMLTRMRQPASAFGRRFLSTAVADAPLAKPAIKPASPNFSSGPCAKRPGYSLTGLADAPLGRSHRAKIGKSKLAGAITQTRELLEANGLPKDYHIGIVPASDTGAVEMAMWSLLGPKPVTVVHFESFGGEWYTDITKQLKLTDITNVQADYGSLPAPRERQLEDGRRRLHLQWHDRRRALPAGLGAAGRPRGPRDLRRDVRRLRDGHAVGQPRRRHLLVAKVPRRRGRARYAHPLARAVERIESYDPPCSRRSSA